MSIDTRDFPIREKMNLVTELTVLGLQWRNQLGWFRESAIVNSYAYP